MTGRPTRVHVVTHVHVTVTTVGKHVPPRVKQAAHTATHRPPETDPHREDWDRAARFAWHLFVIFTSITVMLLTDRYLSVTMSAVLTDKFPEGISEVVEYMKKL
jgi:hypothetical protein